ncbi:cytochrome c oxidase subunit 8C, mitochondrial [Nycticebus coucang]|uniref:cytochrome c oxidase subunit 8C, mitochondrial n=1 Tax=Nycticebus coucang TaxID=9470 RepID=UPI00234E0982|nr:cytochrome c oxidase subunit 8C, mitochondrial [Nycticebus coucang]
MPSLPWICPVLSHRRRVALICLQSRRRLTHSEPPHRRAVSGPEMVVGFVVIFTTFLTPGAYVLSNLSQFRRE